MKARHFALFALASLAAGSAHAATFTWTNPSGGSWGASGNWDSAPTFAADDVLDFSTLNIISNAVTTLDGDRSAGALKFGDATTVSNNWTVNAGTSGTLTLATTAGNATITTVASGDAVTLNIPIAGAGTQTIQKIGAGTLNLTGTNTFTGLFLTDTTANSIINVSGDQSAATGGWKIDARATVNFQAGSTVTVASGKSIQLANSSAAVHTLNAAGTVTATGTLLVNAAGVLNINSGAAWTQNGGMTIQPQQSYFTPIMNVNTGGSFTYAGTTAISLSSSVKTNGGSATLNLSGGTFTTGKNINNSTVDGDGSTTATGSAGSANLTFSNGGTLKLSADIASLMTTATGGRPFNVMLGTGGGIIDTNGFSTTIAQDVTDVSGQTGSLTKQGEGSLTLSGINTYTGATTVNAGILSVSATDQFSDTADVSLTTGATLDLNFTDTADTVGSFRIDGVTQATGVWGRSGSIAELGADYETSLITGDGLIDNTNAAVTDYYWDGTGSTWAATSSWSYAAANPANDPDTVPDDTKNAIFGGDGLVADQTVQLGGDRFLAKLTFVSPVAFNFTGGGSNSLLTVGGSGITLDATSGGAVFGSITAGQQVIPTLGAAQTWTNQSTSGPLGTYNGIGLGASTLTTAGAGDFSLDGALTGTGGLRKMGAGFLDLPGTNTFTGDKTVDRGAVWVSGDQTSSTGSWILRGYSDSGSTYNTTATTVTFDSGSTLAVASGKTVQLGNLAPVGGFQAQTIQANGTVTNDGTLFAGRGGIFNVGGAWTQNGTATIASLGGGTAAMNINTGGSFTYNSATPFALSTSGSNNVYTNLTIDGGTFATGTNINNAYPTFSAIMGSKVILTNGGKISLSANIADLFTTAGAQNFFQVGTGGGIVDTNGFSTALNVPVTGAGDLTKAGAGTLTTTGTNSYTGNTIVNGGTLSLAGANLDDASSVTIASGAVLNLDFADTDTVASLSINGSALTAGEYSHTTHPAFITGTGSITVAGSGAGFASWASDLGLAGTANADYDQDGITDAAEYVLGTDPKVGNTSGIQVQHSGSNLVVTFSRDDASETSDITLTVEAGEDLQSWTQSFHVADTTGNSDSGVQITENDASADVVVVTIPTSGAAKLFARLKVVVSGS